METTAVLIFLGGAAFLIIIVLANNVLFWAHAAQSAQMAQIHRMAEGKLWKWALIGFISSILSLVLVLLFYPLGFSRQRWEVRTDVGSSPFIIILIHGLYQNAGSWFLFRRRLRRAGFKHIYTVGYNSFELSFFEILDLLQNQIDQIRGRFPGGRFVLIGHSLGGLFCRAYSDGIKDPANIAGVITLGAPHGGTKLACLGTGRLARSLRYHGDLIQAIERGASPVSIPRIAFYSPIDTIVIPQDALQPQSPGWVCEMTPPIGHAAMLFHGATFERVLSQLQSISGKSIPASVDPRSGEHLI
jgi:triacylglycerol esterase/lipase EstA (alpha/beta hydrolase family)